MKSVTIVVVGFVACFLCLLVTIIITAFVNRRESLRTSKTNIPHMKGSNIYGAVVVNPDGSTTPFDPSVTPSPAQAEANHRRNAGPFYNMMYTDALKLMRSKGMKGEVLVLRWNDNLDAPPITTPKSTTVLHVNDAGIVEFAQPGGYANAQQHGTVVTRVTL